MKQLASLFARTMTKIRETSKDVKAAFSDLNIDVKITEEDIDVRGN